MNKARLIVLLALIAIAGCKKKENKDSSITFNNGTSKQITLTIYPNMSAYAGDSNAVLRKSIKAGDILSIPDTALAYGRTYYMDWYTDDFYINNWFNDAYPQPGTQVAFTPASNNKSFYFSPSLTGYSRSVFLSNNDLSSSWHAVDAYMYSSATGYKSFWSGMSESEQYRHITVYKDFSARYTYKDGTGMVIGDTLNFKVQHSDDAYIQFMDAKGKSLGNMATGILPTGAPPTYRSNSKDTVMALLPGADYYYIMTRD